MFYLSPEGDRYYLGRAFNYPPGSEELVQYGAGYATDAKFTELGFTKVVIEQRPDDRFYIVSGPDNTGAYSSTPRDLDQLKLSFTGQELQTTQQLLTATDWLFIRANEVSRGVDVAIPSAVITNRDEIRDVCGANCDLISATESVEQLEALVKAPAEVSEDPEDSEAGFITNPDPHLLPYPAVEPDAFLTRDLLAPMPAKAPARKRVAK